MEKLFTWYDDRKKAYLYGALIACSASSTTQQFFGEPLYHASGAAACLVGRAADIAVSLRGVRLWNSERFKSSGLENELYEKNLLTGKHPTMKKFCSVAAVTEPIVLLFSAIYPPLGYLLLANAPFIYYNNAKKVDDLEAKLNTTQ